ncbi:hypothetical protein BX616_004068 [Lobosporangium transversale]|nr:hypothetical protein BX616_004068 [Lobosporangium transversale]
MSRPSSATLDTVSLSKNSITGPFSPSLSFTQQLCVPSSITDSANALILTLKTNRIPTTAAAHGIRQSFDSGGAITSSSDNDLSSSSGDIPSSRPSPLSIPEILQEICLYLDRSALNYASRVSKQFRACSAPLLWTSIPLQAWENKFFQENWHHHGSQILSLHCGPGTDLGRVSLYCRNLVVLDVSRIRNSIKERADANNDNGGRIHRQQSVITTPRTTENGRKPTMTMTMTNHIATTSPPKETYDSFLQMADDLVQVIRANKGLRSLQLEPQGRFPPHLLSALSQLDNLEMLSLNAWRDFQEYSLQLIMEMCPKLFHLSLGENDFTQFTLRALFDSDQSRLHKPKLIGTAPSETHILLERYDDPIKGRNGSAMPQYQDPLEIYSKRAALYTTTFIQDPALDLCPMTPTIAMTRPQDQHHMHQLSMKGQNLPNTLQSQIRSLSLHQAGLRQEFLVNLTRQCPHLQHLSLLDGWGFYPSSRFASILSQVCPNLSKIEFRGQAMDLQDEFFVSLCRHNPQLRWLHAGGTGFTRGALDAVRIHCKDIVSLNLDGTRGIQSPSLDHLLRTCVSLKAISAQGVVLNGRDVGNQGTEMWACRGLETLRLDIEIYAFTPASAVAPTEAELVFDSVKNVRKRVYDQLAALTRLKIGFTKDGQDAGMGGCSMDD